MQCFPPRWVLEPVLWCFRGGCWDPVSASVPVSSPTQADCFAGPPPPEPQLPDWRFISACSWSRGWEAVGCRGAWSKKENGGGERRQLQRFTFSCAVRVATLSTGTQPLITLQSFSACSYCAGMYSKIELLGFIWSHKLWTYLYTYLMCLCMLYKVKVRRIIVV